MHAFLTQTPHFAIHVAISHCRVEDSQIADEVITIGELIHRVNTEGPVLSASR